MSPIPMPQSSDITLLSDYLRVTEPGSTIVDPADDDAMSLMRLKYNYEDVELLQNDTEFQFAPIPEECLLEDHELIETAFTRAQAASAGVAHFDYTDKDHDAHLSLGHEVGDVINF